MGRFERNAHIVCVRQYFHHCFLFAHCVKVLFLHRSQQTEEVVKRGFSMEKKIVYFNLMQIVLTLAFIWKLISLHQFCGTFADPKGFIHENISIGHCKRFTLIGKDSKSGEFGAMFDHHKWHNQFFASSSTNGRPIEEQKLQFMDELATKLPPAGRLCIPIMISPFDWIGKDTNLLNNGTLSFFSGQLIVALCLLAVGFMDLLFFSVVEYELMSERDKYWPYLHAFHSAFGWCISAWFSSKLLLYWTDFWTCVNFQADHTNVPFITLVISIVMVCSSVFVIFFKNSLLKKRFVTECANVIIHQQKNGSAVIM